MPDDRPRQLRQTATEAERRLWSALRDRQLGGAKFRRQHRIGPFIADFACVEHRLVIEADGGQHADNPADARRTAWLRARGWTVLRLWNNDILANPDGVRAVILQVLTESAATTLTLPP
jgi:very-short-patch-repair endonuclease